MAIPGKNARLKVMNEDAPVGFADKAMSADAEYKTYAIDDTDKRYWSRDADIVVKKNAETVDPSEYKVQHAGGLIHFKTAQGSEDTITASGEFVTVSTAAYVREYTLNISANLEDTTWLKPTTEEDPTYTGAGYRNRTPTLTEASGSLSGFYDVDNYFQERLLSGKPLVIEMDTDGPNTNGDFFAVYAYLENKELSPAVEGVVGQSVSWQSDGQLLVEGKSA